MMKAIMRLSVFIFATLIFSSTYAKTSPTDALLVPSLSRLNILDSTVRLPATCYCAVLPKNKNSICLDFTNKKTGQCKARACEASYECKPGKKSGMVCIKRKTTKKIVETTPGYCKEKSIKGYQYVPYNAPAAAPTSGLAQSTAGKTTRSVPKKGSLPSNNKAAKNSLFNILPVKKPNLPNPKPKTVVELKPEPKPVIVKPPAEKSLLPKLKHEPGPIIVKPPKKLPSKNKQAKLPTTMLPVKKPAMTKTEPKQTSSLRQKPVKKPYKSASKPECLGRPVRGPCRARFLRYYYDTRSKRCRRFVYGGCRGSANQHRTKRACTLACAKPRYILKSKPVEAKKPAITRTQNKRGMFIIIAENRVVGRTKSLKSAKNLLRRYRRGPRAIFQVGKRGRVLGPYKIAGSYFGGRRTVKHMRRVTEKYYRKHIRKNRPKSNKPKKSYIIRTQNKRGTFIIVVGKKVVGMRRRLNPAKSTLSRYRGRQRAIFQINKRGDVLGPYKIAGYPQNRKFGFNSFFRNTRTVRGMRRVAKQYYARFIHKHRQKSKKPKRKRPIKTANKRGQFIIVVGKKVVGMTKRLNPAKSTLASYRKAPRAIFEVKGGRVRPPNVIAGYPQTGRYGFNSYFKSKKTTRRLFVVANRYYHKISSKVRPRPRPNPRKPKKKLPIKTANKFGKFIIVAQNKVVGMTRRLDQAKSTLASYRRGPRAIFEVIGKQVRVSNMVAGYLQTGKYGFNSYFKNKKTVYRMMSVAKRYYRTITRKIRPRSKPRRKSLPKKQKKQKKQTIKTENKSGKFIIVFGKKAVGMKFKLEAAKRKLRGHRKGLRAIFEVKQGRVRLPNTIAGYPQTGKYGFNSYFKNKKTAYRMMGVAQAYYRKYKARHRPRPKPKKVVTSFVVVSRGKRGYRRYRSESLKQAKDKLKKYAKYGGSRCMFEVRGNIVLKDPHTIAGQQQLPKYGFFKFWHGWSDIKKMHKVAVKYVKNPPRHRRRRRSRRRRRGLQ